MIRLTDAHLHAAAPLPYRAVGAGLVGTQVLHQITLPHIAARLRIDVISNSKYQLEVAATSDRSNIGNLLTLLPSSSSTSTKPVPEGFKVTKHTLEEFVQGLTQAESGGPRLLIDCTSSQTVAELYPQLLRSGISVVTPNKKAFSSSQALFAEIQKSKSRRGLVYQESTVGAGLPIISTLNDLIATGDKIHKIEGVLSGTLSYIFNEFSKPVKGGKAQSFSEIVKVAKEQGYTVCFGPYLPTERPVSGLMQAVPHDYTRNHTRQTTCLAPMLHASFASCRGLCLPSPIWRKASSQCRPRRSSPPSWPTLRPAPNLSSACQSLTITLRRCGKRPRTQGRCCGTWASSMRKRAKSSAA